MESTGPSSDVPLTNVVLNEKELKELRRRKFLKEFWKNVFIGLGVLAAAVSILFNIYLSLKTQQIALDTRRGADRLVDCTTPGGKCFEQGRSATSGAIGTINKATIATVYCNNNLGPKATIAQLSSCVKALVK